MAQCCLQSTRSFFCSTDNHLAKFIRSSEGQDKLAKFMVEGVFPVVTEVARLSGASESTMQNIETGRSAVKLTRDVTGTLNIFRGVIPGMVMRGKQVGGLVQGLWTGEDVQLRPPKSGSVRNPNTVTVNGVALPGSARQLAWTTRPKHNEVAVGRTEKLLKLGENAGGMVGALTYTAGFGVARPAANVRKYFGVEYGDVGNRIADSFPYIMCANHVGVVFQQSFELAYQFKAYERAMTDPTNNPQDVDKAFSSKVVDSVMVMIEKVLELVNDTMLFMRVAAPTWLKIPLGLGISGIGLVRVWRKTA